MHLMIIGTHPLQTTGYSKVMYNIIKQLENYSDIFVSVFGIQKFTDVNDNIRSDIEGHNVLLWDVYKNDKEDFGFGTQTLRQFVLNNNPDVVMVYNDPNVVDKYIQNLNLIPNRKFKIVVYLDQIYDFQSENTLNYICNNSDHIFCFTDYWLQNLRGYVPDFKRCSVLRHGLSTDKIKPLNSAECKLQINFKDTDFIFLNLNRNQSRKRLEFTVIGFVKFLKRYRPDNAYLFFPNLRDAKGIDIIETFKYELRREGLNKDYINFLKFTPLDRVLTDDEINLIYNACDVGVNTCEAEGFGLCSYEHAILGKPQIVSNLGGLKDYFNISNSMPLEPKWRVYTNNGGDLSGDSNLIDVEDVCEAMGKYYSDKGLYQTHSKALSSILEKYNWEKEVQHLVKTIKSL